MLGRCLKLYENILLFIDLLPLSKIQLFAVNQILMRHVWPSILRLPPAEMLQKIYPFLKAIPDKLYTNNDFRRCMAEIRESVTQNPQYVENS